MFRKRTHQSAFCISPKRVRHKRHSAVFYILKSNMATPSAALLERLDKQGIPKSKRKLQKHLRSAGLAYISRTGKLIPAKKVAEELCQCPQKCDERVPMEARECLFKEFYGLGDADLQNQFLRENMDLRARLNVPETTGTGRPPRRITCKYLVPLLPTNDKVEVCQKAFVSAFVITTKRVRLQREKLISSLGLNSYSSHNRSTKTTTTPLLNNNNTLSLNDLCMKLNGTTNGNGGGGGGCMPLFTFNMSTDCEMIETGPSNLEPKMTQQQQQQQQDYLTMMMPSSTQYKDKQPKIKRTVVDNPLIPLGLMLPDGVTIAPVTATPDHDRDIAIVHNFFSNQLWKPEYIGAYS